jgi:hypothetical protein
VTDLRYVVYIVGAALLLSIAGIIGLAATTTAGIPDVLQNLAVGSLTGLVGLLVPTTGRHRRSRGDDGYGAVELAIGAVVLVILVLILVRLVT